MMREFETKRLVAEIRNLNEETLKMMQETKPIASRTFPGWVLVVG